MKSNHCALRAETAAQARTAFPEAIRSARRSRVPAREWAERKKQHRQQGESRLAWARPASSTAGWSLLGQARDPQKPTGMPAVEWAARASTRSPACHAIAVHSNRPRTIPLKCSSMPNGPQAVPSHNNSWWPAPARRAWSSRTFLRKNRSCPVGKRKVPTIVPARPRWSAPRRP
jgi:hypothetical protein